MLRIIPVAKVKHGRVLREIRTLYSVGTIRELSDGQLLERFTTDRGEAAELAFAVLVERHGPMVFRVCKGVLAGWQDAEDAFQATFLVLVKKARALGVRDSLGPWLHQVAFRTASSARISAARRHRCEDDVPAMTLSKPDRASDELEAALHEEIERLPERFRSPVVLCDLEERTHQQAARHLGWPIGTVKSRLARGRQRLRERLSRRGLAPDAALMMAVGRLDGSITLRLPPLVDSTARAAVGFASTRAIAAASIATLTEAVLRGMMISQWLKAGMVVLVIATAGSGAGLLAMHGGTGRESPRTGTAGTAEPPTLTVKPGKLHAVVSEPGIVATARSWTTTCQVPGESIIKWILPDRSVVKKGDLVCQLDSSALENQLKRQSEAVKAAEAAYKASRLTRELAEIAVVEYTKGIADQDRKTLLYEIDAAGAAVAKSEARLGRTRQTRDRIRDAIDLLKKTASPADILAEFEIEDVLEAAEQDSAKKKASLTQAKSKLARLETSTRPTTIKKLTAGVAEARADELAKLAAWNLEKAKAEKLSRQIENCKLRAPAEGVVVFANDSSGRNRHAIAVGATVRQHQIIFKMPDAKSPLRVVTHVPQWSIGQVKREVKARLKFNGIADRFLTATVTEIAPLPDPMSSFGGRLVYSISLRVDDPPAALVPDMQAQVEIDVADLDNVLSVPTAAVRKINDRDHLAVKKPDGGFEWCEVTLGMSGATSVEVKRGIQTGEQIIVDPATLPIPDEKPRKAIPPAAKLPDR